MMQSQKADVGEVRVRQMATDAMETHEPFRHYYERVDTTYLSPLVDSCINGYSEGMLRPLSDEDLDYVPSYDEAVGSSLRNVPESPDWVVYASDQAMLQRSLSWVGSAGVSPDCLRLTVLLDAACTFPDAFFIEYWAAAGIPAENISLSRVDSDTIPFAEYPWGECWLFVDEHTSNWLYWYWRGKKDQMASISGNPSAWKEACAILDQMIDAEAEECGFDPRP